MHEFVAGKNSVREVLRAGKRHIYKVYLARSKPDHIVTEIEILASKRKIPVQSVSPDELSKICEDPKPHGIAAEVVGYPFTSLDTMVSSFPEGGFLILADEIQDPQNLGALIRTAHLAGAAGFIVPKHRSAPISASVVRASAGATEYMAICQVTNLVQAIEGLKENRFTVYGASPAGLNLYETKFSGILALVVGAEGKGLRRLVREHCDSLIAIPMRGRIDSYNVSAAGAMIMGEIMRQSLTRQEA